jgi:hypothetical protein
MKTPVMGIANQVDCCYGQTDVEIAHPDVVFYDYYGAWDEPIVADTETYLGEPRKKSQHHDQGKRGLTSRSEQNRPVGPGRSEYWPDCMSTYYCWKSC